MFNVTKDASGCASDVGRERLDHVFQGRPPYGYNNVPPKPKELGDDDKLLLEERRKLGSEIPRTPRMRRGRNSSVTKNTNVKKMPEIVRNDQIMMATMEMPQKSKRKNKKLNLRNLVKITGATFAV